MRDNSLLYVQQTLLLNDSRMDAVSFQLYKNEIEEQLRNAGYDGIFLCSPEGALLAGDAGAFRQIRVKTATMIQTIRWIISDCPL